MSAIKRPQVFVGRLNYLRFRRPIIIGFSGWEGIKKQQPLEVDNSGR